MTETVMLLLSYCYFFFLSTHKSMKSSVVVKTIPTKTMENRDKDSPLEAKTETFRGWPLKILVLSWSVPLNVLVLASEVLSL